MATPGRKQLTKPFQTEKRRQIEKLRHVLGVCLVGRSVSSGSYQEVYSGSVVRGLLQFKEVQNKVFLLVSDNALSKKDLDNLRESKSCDSIAEKYTLFFIDRKDPSKLKTYDLHEITSEEEEVTLDRGLVIIPIDHGAQTLKKKSGILDYRPFPVNKEKVSLGNSLCQIVQGNTSCFSVRTLLLEHKGENYSLKLSEQESFKTLTDFKESTNLDLHPDGAVILREGKAVGVLNFVDDKIVPRDFATSQVFGCAGSIKNQVVDGDGNSTADSKQAEERHFAESVNISSRETHQPTAKDEMTPNESSSNKGNSPGEDVNEIGGKGKGSKEQTTGNQRSLPVTIGESLNELASFNATTSKDSSQASGSHVDHNAEVLHHQKERQLSPSKTIQMADFRRMCSEMGFIVVDNDGQGNCMFIALSDQLDLKEISTDSYKELRQSSVEYLRKNPKMPACGTELSGFLENNKRFPLSEYLENMAKEGTWGDDMILYAVANCYGVRIKVISSLSRAHDRIISPEQECAVNSNTELVVGHFNESHYVSLRPNYGIETKSSQLATEKIDSLTSEQENLQERVTQVEGKLSFGTPQISSEISDCDGDIAFFAERCEEGTREWLFEDFNNWFRDPGTSRAYVLVGDAGVGKSVMAGALAQRRRKAGQLGAAYFCRHNDDTRNDPRYLLGTVACQLSECNREYSNLVGGENGVRMMLAKSKLGVIELFTKLLQEPLAKCTPCEQRKLVIIDALDDTEYQSREDFLDLLMHQFPLLPKWLVFFITSRPEDTVQVRLKKYNPCVKICAGDSAHADVYQQHEGDIRKYLEKKLDFSRLAFSLEDLTAKCNGLFLYAHYIVEELNDPVHTGKIGGLSDLFPGNIEEYFRKNFKRVCDKVGGDLYRKLFGCVIAAPSPLPLSFISFLLKRESLNLDEQEVIDAVSQFVVHRTADQTFVFRHNLIPSWLTVRKKASPELSIDRVEAGEYFKGIILGLLPVVVNDQSKRSPSVESDLVDYLLRNGVHILCGYDEKASLDIVYSCLTSYQFIQRRIQTSPIEIYSVVSDLHLSARCQALDDTQREILQEMCIVLESNIHSLLQCPHLLLSCLKNVSKVLQCKLGIPDGISPTWLEWNGLCFPVCEFPRDMSCFALSPNKMLLAGGKDQSISLFDACSLEKVAGPVTVLESYCSINHLEFSPDGKFVFFGKLDRLFSVDRGCVQEFPQFTRATMNYRWGSFVSNGRYLVVKRGHYMREHRRGCLADVFYSWAMQEFNQIQRDGIVSSPYLGRSFERFRSVLAAFGLPVVVSGIHHTDCYDTLETVCKNAKFEEPCHDCLTFKHKHKQLTLAIVRQRVIDLYGDIFLHQVWDVQSGNNVLEGVFSSSVELSPFLFLCHLPPSVFQKCQTLFWDVSKSLLLFIIASLNAIKCAIRRKFTLQRLPIESFILTNVTKEFYDRIGCYGAYSGGPEKCSPDKKWIAVMCRRDVVRLFKETNQEDKRVVVFEHAYVYNIRKVMDFDFTHSSKVIVFVTEDELLQALSLETGTIFTSVSGLSPLYYTPERQVGYVFRSSHEEIQIFINDFPTGLLRIPTLHFDAAPVGLTFTSETGIKSVFEDGRVTSWTISDSEVSRAVFSECRSVEKDDQGKKKLVKRCALSLGGELIAIHRLSEIRLLRKLKSDIVVFRESKKEGDWNVSWLTFSADGTLLLYCIQRINDYASVHVWDVQKETSVAFCPRKTLIDCGYLSPNNSKLVICGELSVEILEFDLSNHRLDLLARLELGRLCIYSEFEKFSCCTVSSDNELLACCIADGIYLYPLCTPTQQSLRQLPRGHLGRIEFCHFLKGTRYLISYGVDGAVFLWDLSEWKAVAFARIVHGRESIVSLDVSPKMDKVVCLTSFNRFIIIKLHGLISDATPLAFLSVGVTGSQGLTRETSRGQLSEQAMVLQSVVVPNEEQIEGDMDQLLKDMAFVLSSEESEDGDEDESDVMLTD